MSSALVWYEVEFPREVDPKSHQQIFRFLATSGALPLVIEICGTTESVIHRIGVPEGQSGGLANLLRSSLPGLNLKAVTRPKPSLSRAVSLRLSTKRRQIRVDYPETTASALLAALSHVGGKEELVLQWYLTRSLVPTSVPAKTSIDSSETVSGLLVAGLLTGAHDIDTELRTAMRTKQSEPGWRGLGRLGVSAASDSRERQLIRHFLGALRTAEAPGVGFRVRSTAPQRVSDAVIPWLAPMRLNALELASLSAWPVGPTADLPIKKISSTMIAPPRGAPRRGRVLGDATFPGREQPISLPLRDSLRHLHVLGPTGSGKSTLLCNLIVQDMEQGRGVVVIEPKGDLIEDVLKRIPSHRLDDVVLLDPTDLEKPVGLNPLAREGQSAELVADQLLGVFHALYASSWGPRTSDILGSSLLTLARTSGASLVNLPILLTDSRYRRKIVGGIDDPIALGPFWAQYEEWGEAERAAAIAPSMNKLRPFIMRPELRGVLGQNHPKFQIRDVFTKRRIFLVNLAKGQLGPESSALLGALIVAQLWQTILSRSKVDPEKRHSVFVYVDEFQDYLKLPLDFADVLAQSRGLGVGLVLAHQYLQQLDTGTRTAVLQNAQSRVAFRLAHEDAVALAHQSVPSVEDFQGLPAYHAYSQLVVGNSVGRWLSLQSRPMVPETSNPTELRENSSDAYGIDRSAIDDAIRELIQGTPSDQSGTQIGRRRRSGEEL